MSLAKTQLGNTLDLHFGGSTLCTSPTSQPRIWQLSQYPAPAQSISWCHLRARFWFPPHLSSALGNLFFLQSQQGFGTIRRYLGLCAFGGQLTRISRTDVAGWKEKAELEVNFPHCSSYPKQQHYYRTQTRGLQTRAGQVSSPVFMFNRSFSTDSGTHWETPCTRCRLLRGSLYQETLSAFYNTPSLHKTILQDITATKPSYMDLLHQLIC